LEPYEEYRTKIFVDSNIILEGKPLKELPWSEIDPVGPILVLLTPTLLREVDSKKRDGRLGPLAREFNRMISPLASKPGVTLTVLSGTPQVDLSLARCAKIPWDDYDDLDPSEGDSRIVAEVLHANEIPADQKILVSQDLNPIFKAQRYGITTRHISDTWLRPVEPSKHDKEMMRLKQRVQTLEKQEPEFSVAFKVGVQTPVETYSLERLTGEEASSLTQSIFAANPKPTQEPSSPLLMQYDDTLDKRYETYRSVTVPKFVEQYHAKLELYFGQIPFQFELNNTGSVRADHLVVEVSTNTGWLSSKPVLVITRGPSAPRIKDRFERMRTVASLVHSRTPVPGRHEVVMQGPNRSERLTAVCEDFRHGRSWIFDGVVWVDPSQDRLPVISVRITAANLHDAVTETYVVERTVKRVRAEELVDLGTKKLLKQPAIQPVINEAIGNSKFDAVEFDKGFIDD
jgi:hypothetical protein